MDWPVVILILGILWALVAIIGLAVISIVFSKDNKDAS